MKRPQRRTHYNMVTVFGEEAPASRPGVVASDTMAYDPSTDELTVKMWEGAWFRIRPGAQFAGRLAELMAEAEAATATASLPTVHPCRSCGELIRSVSDVEGVSVELDAKPNPNGVYLLQGEDRARLLRPLEEPTGPTFRLHDCRGWRGERTGGDHDQ